MKTDNKKTTATKFYDCFRLGADERCHISTDPEKTQLNNNILAVGGAGSGKSSSVVMPILMHLTHSNAVGIFTKRSLMEKMNCVLKKRGYTTTIIDFANPKESKYGFDPLLYCKTEDDVRDLAHWIVYSDTNTNHISDPYWYDSAENLIDLVLRYVWNGHYGEKRSMAAALKLLDGIVWKEPSDDDEENIFDTLDTECENALNEEDKNGDKKTEEVLNKTKSEMEKIEAERKRKRLEEYAKLYPTHKEFERLKEVDPDGAIIWKSFTDLPDKTGTSIAGSVQTAIFNMFQADIRKILSAVKFYDFKNLTKEKNVLLLYVSPVSIAQHRYVSLFYKQLFKNLFELAENYENYALPYPVHVLCDDFATGCKIERFDELISIFREKRISVTLLLQSESQLESMYGDTSATTIINNCDTYVYFGGMDLKTAIHVCKRLNAPLADILSMPVGKEYFFRRGQKPIITERYNPFKDEVYTKFLGTK